jgi:hypothetical protein
MPVKNIESNSGDFCIQPSEEVRLITNRTAICGITGTDENSGPFIARIGINGQVNLHFEQFEDGQNLTDQGIPLKAYIRRRGESDAYVEIAKGYIAQGDIIIARQNDPLNQALASTNETLRMFLEEKLRVRVDKKRNPLDRQGNANYLIDLRENVLVEASLTRMGDIPFDFVAQEQLPNTRKTVEEKSEDVIREDLLALSTQDLGFYKRILGSDLPTQKEALAWALAVEDARQKLIINIESTVTEAELQEAFNKINIQVPQFKEKPIADSSRSIVDVNGDRIPSSEFFTRGEKAPLSVAKLLSLPLRPVVYPIGKPEKGTRGLSEFLFSQILNSPLVCDHRGTNVGLSEEKRNEYLHNIEARVKKGLPLIATEYVPYTAVANPFKRNTQKLGLGELDYIRRHAEISKAVEIYYSPGLIWLLGNEAPAFQGPEFGLSEDYIADFHHDAENAMRLIDPSGRYFHMFNQADITWGTPERKKDWDTFKAERIGSLKEAFDNPHHPQHAEIQSYINTFIYPMATCINPFKLKEAAGLSLHEILQTYAKLKHITGTQFTGVDIIGDTKFNDELSDKQQNLLNYLYSWGKELTYIYRAAMDAREELPSFKEFIPENVIPYTIITKKEKLVLLPNSGKSAWFPAHGEPVLQRSNKLNQRTTVTIRPWWQIAAQTDHYCPIYVEGREEPLYFEEI